MFGAYHMHRVPWAHDRLRDRCTDLDRHLADNCGLWTIIISMVHPDQPRLRAFYEGRNEWEVPFVVAP
jgi:hypothetical protein